MINEGEKREEDDGIDRVVRPELDSFLTGLRDAIRGANAAVQARKDELDSLLDKLAQAESNLAALEHDSRRKYEQVQALAEMEKTLREIQHLTNQMGTQNAEQRMTIQAMVQSIEEILEATEEK
ncbi:hypothetical protein HY732_01845 [Candidatus Uhrbacteria bacterium]|nr:hypothetical protein [Candidatus Uhrbacteria bacterium]